MKILVVADNKDILSLNRVNHIQDLSKLIDSETKMCFIAEALKDEQLEQLKQNGFRIFSLSQLIKQSLLANTPSFSQILSREELQVDLEILKNFYQDQIVCVTGGEGFIGSEIVKHLLSLPVKKVIAYGYGENSAHELIHKHMDDDRFEFVLGDIRDKKKLQQVFNKYTPSIVFHAAAHKHVPILEQYPEEAVKTNIIGTYHVAEAAVNTGVQNFVLVSTDKAVNSTSALGASKRIAEKICLSMDHVIPDTKFSIVRFGNVFGSTGSVVPTFIHQIANNIPLTITDKNMLRYFMSVNEAVDLVLLAGTMTEGNLFSFDMGVPISIDLLLKKLFEFIGLDPSEQPMKIIGNRGGEKFAEELVHSFERIIGSPHEKLFVLVDESPLWTKEEIIEICNQFQDAADSGMTDNIIVLFDKYIKRYIATSHQ